ncbi:MAG: hypothetical protein M1826_006666 [Phylliscum demangeonii]|nr:MAG: hypothetical protein M1826_006666 [Phylliscum demangeonii]
MVENALAEWWKAEDLSVGGEEGRSILTTPAALLGGSEVVGDAVEASDSSHTLMGSPAISLRREPLKRRRSASPSTLADKRRKTAEHDPKARSWISSVFRVLDTLLSFLKQASRVRQTENWNDELYETEYIKLVLKSSPGLAASILGRSLDFASFLLKTDKDDRETIRTITNIVEVVTSLWDHRSGTSDDLEGNASDDAFASQALIPALLLSQALSTSTSEAEPRLTGIVTLLDQSIGVAGLLESLPRLFNLAIRCSKLPGSKSRRDEEAWLKAVFGVLADIAVASNGASPKSALENHQRFALEQLLQVAIDQKIPLSTTGLRSIAIRHAHLFADDEPMETWTLCEKIFTLDSNVFLISERGASIPEAARRLKNPLLEALLAKINLLATRQRSEWGEAQERVWCRIFQPLMTELANARALSAFLRYWHQNIATIEERRLNVTDDEPAISVVTMLESQHNAEALRSVLENSLTPRQIAAELDYSISKIRSLSKSSSAEEKVNAYAALVIVEALLLALSREETIATLQPHGAAIQELLLRQIQTKVWPSAHRWRLWRILNLLQSLWFSDNTEGARHKPGKKEHSKFLKSFKICREVWQKVALPELLPGTRASALYRQAYEIFGWISEMTKSYPLNAVEMGCAEQLLRDAVLFLSWSLRTILSEGAKPMGWNTSPDGLQDEAMLATALLCSLDLREAVLRSLFTLAVPPTGYPKRTEPAAISVADIWESVLASEYILNNVELKDALVNMLVLQIAPTRKPRHKTQQGFPASHFAVVSLTKLPLAVLNSKQQESIVDALQVTDPDGLWKLAVRCESKRDLDTTTVTTFDELASLTLSRTFSARHKHLLSHYLERSLDWLAKLTEADRLCFLHAPLSSCLLKNLSSVSWKNRGRLDLSADDQKLLGQVREAHVARLVAELQLSHRDWAKISFSGAKTALELVLDSVAEIPNLNDPPKPRLGYPATRVVTDALDRFLALRAADRPTTDPDEFLLLRMTALRIIGRNEGWRGDHTVQMAQHLNRASGPYDQVAISSILRESISQISETARLEMLQALVAASVVDEQDGCHGYLLALRTGISAQSDHSADARKALSRIYGRLCHQLQRCHRMREFRLLMDCMELILSTRSRALSQWNVEATMAAIVYLTSSRAPPLAPGRHAEYIYSRLCGLMHGLLVLHRLSLNGRFHLVILTLQSLLRCLFTPPPLPRGRFRLPGWVVGGGVGGQHHALAAPAARAYARLVSTVCEPPLSSVTRRRRGRPAPHSTSASASASHPPDLTPAIDKARRLAGQHLPALLMEYIHCRLRAHHLTGTTTAAADDSKVALLLRPAMYAVMDLLRPATMGMINDAMDASGRALFKALYRDYGRFRRGNQA